MDSKKILAIAFLLCTLSHFWILSIPNYPVYINKNNLVNPIVSQHNINLDWFLKNVFENNIDDLNNWLAKIIVKNNKHGDFTKTLLHEAASSGFYDLVKEILKQRPNINSLDYKHRTPLHLAIKKGLDDISKLLISSNADLNIKDNIKCETPFFYAINNMSSIDLIELLISKDQSQVNSINANLQRPLHIACQNNDTPIVELLINSNANINAKDQNGFTCADIALQNGHTDLVRYLISKRTKLTGDTSIKRNIIYNLKIMLNYNLNYLNLEFDDTLENPYRLALINNRLDIAKALLNFFWNKIDIYQKSLAIDWAIFFNKPSILNLIIYKLSLNDLYEISCINTKYKLFEKIEKILNKQFHKDILLEIACTKGNYKLALILLGLGSNKNGTLKLQARNASLSPLYCAIESNHAKIVKLLLKHKPSPFVIKNGSKKNILNQVNDSEISQIIENYKNKHAAKIQDIVQKNFRCIICLELAKEKAETPCCKQLIHQECWDKCLESQNRCPHCRTQVRNFQENEEITLEYICNRINSFTRNNLSNDRVNNDRENFEDLSNLLLCINNLFLINGSSHQLRIDEIISFIVKASSNNNQTRNEATPESLRLAMEEIIAQSNNNTNSQSNNILSSTF